MFVVEKYKFNGIFNQMIEKKEFDKKGEAEEYKNYQEEYYGFRCYIEELPSVAESQN